MINFNSKLPKYCMVCGQPIEWFSEISYEQYQQEYEYGIHSECLRRALNEKKRRQSGRVDRMPNQKSDFRETR